MDAAFRTPLVDCFRRGEVEREVRLLAARGAVAPRAHEQVALLMLLVDDEDPAIAATADETLRCLPAGPLAAFLARSDVGQDVRAFFEARGVQAGDTATETTEAPLTEAHDEAGAPVSEAPGEDPGGTEEVAARVGTAQRLAALNVAARVKVAMQGTREERAVLIRDSNRLVSAAVLSSPKLSESEVEAISRMTNVSDEVLRIVGTTRAWIKNYNVISALTRNAKTPVGITLNLLNRLVTRDIKMLSTDRNIPEPVRVSARKLYVQSQTRRQ